MLSNDTIVRTPTGNRSVGSLRLNDQVFDSSNQIINVSVGPSTPLQDAHRVVFRPYHASRNGLYEDITHIVVDAQHRLHLVAPKVVAATVERDRKEPDILTIVNWHTLCTEHTTPEAQARAELAELEWPAVPPPPATYLRPRTAVVDIATAYEAPSSSPVAAPSSDPSYAPSSDVDEDLDVVQDDNGSIFDGHDDDERSDDDEPMQPAPSSDTFLQDAAYSPQLVNRAQKRLASDGACQCGMSRTFSLSCGNETHARYLYLALRTPELAWRVDSKALLPGDPHEASVAQYMASPHVTNPATGAPPQRCYLKLTRFPFEVVTIQGATADDLPIDPRWLGYWLGDGEHDGTGITSVDLEETRPFLAAYVDRLNASRPRGTAPLQLHIRPHLWHEGMIHANFTAWELSITSTFREHEGGYWNPLRDGLRTLGIFDNFKRYGIPRQYLRASQDARAALLAGLIDTDGSLVSSTIYEFSQGVVHRQLFEHTRELAEGLGIKVGNTSLHYSTNPSNEDEQTESLRCIMTGPALALIQPYILLPRKRVRGTFYDNHLRTFRVERAGGADVHMGRTIRCEGRDVTLVQQEDGYIFRGD